VQRWPRTEGPAPTRQTTTKTKQLRFVFIDIGDLESRDNTLALEWLTTFRRL
jgi:hypothetical protein